MGSLLPTTQRRRTLPNRILHKVHQSRALRETLRCFHRKGTTVRMDLAVICGSFHPGSVGNCCRPTAFRLLAGTKRPVERLRTLTAASTPELLLQLTFSRRESFLFRACTSRFLLEGSRKR